MLRCLLIEAVTPLTTAACRMPIFKITGTKLKKLNSLPFDKEKNLQTLIEANLLDVLDVLDVLFLTTEYAATFDGRIDTLAVEV